MKFQLASEQTFSCLQAKTNIIAISHAHAHMMLYDTPKTEQRRLNDGNQQKQDKGETSRTVAFGGFEGRSTQGAAEGKRFTCVWTQIQMKYYVYQLWHK